jgi:hypothetical protein
LAAALSLRPRALSRPRLVWARPNHGTRGHIPLLPRARRSGASAVPSRPGNELRAPSRRSVGRSAAAAAARARRNAQRGGRQLLPNATRRSLSLSLPAGLLLSLTRSDLPRSQNQPQQKHGKKNNRRNPRPNRPPAERADGAVRALCRRGQGRAGHGRPLLAQRRELLARHRAVPRQGASLLAFASPRRPAAAPRALSRRRAAALSPPLQTAASQISPPFFNPLSNLHSTIHQNPR